MNRLIHYQYIVSRLSVLAYEIEIRGKLNLLDQHLHAENFYLHFLNELFGWKLENINVHKSNVEAIDLIDLQNKIVVQVSATATKTKIESALSKDLRAYAGYSFKFVSISKDVGTLRNHTFSNPHNLIYNPQMDIYDIPMLLRHIATLGLSDLWRIFSLIKKELGHEVDSLKLESNLAAIINIMALEDLLQGVSQEYPVPFAIDEKIKYNNLRAACTVIDDYTFHHGRVTRIYTDFDKAGQNRSLSVLTTIRHDYLANKECVDGDTLFFKVIADVAERVQASANFAPIPVEELELCVNILVVDAFIRCKIFKNPEGYVHAAP